MNDLSNGSGGQGMLLVEAVEALKSSWSAGESSIESIGKQLEPSTRLPTLLQLVRMDCELALKAGQIVDAQRYLELFPELASHRSTIEQFVRESRLKPNTANETDAQGISLADMFSKASIAPTIDHVSDGDKQGSSKPNGDKTATTSVLPMLGNYRILNEIGTGSFGQVYLGMDVRLNRLVAIKIQSPKRGDQGLSDGFLHEARAISRLEHPNIVRLHHVDETENGVGYLVYEHVTGTTLAERVKQANFSIADIVGWIAAIARALDYAHRRGVIHRDISPRNIMISEDGTAKLLDFGLSRVDDSFHVADENQLLGTPNFMSPEQASGKPHWATSYADIFSLGCVLYYALAGKAPFQGSSVFDICERIQSATPPPLRSIRDDIPSRLEAVVNKAMAKEPQARYATGADFAIALEGAMATTQPVEAKPAANNSLLVRVAALIIVCLGAGFFWLAWKQYEDSAKRNQELLASPAISSVEILVARDQSQRNLLSDHIKSLLPLKPKDQIGISWQTTVANLNAVKPTLLVFNQANMKFVAAHPSTEYFNLTEELLDGTSLVLLCLTKDEIKEEDLKKLALPFTSQSVFDPLRLDYISFRAPTLRNIEQAFQRSVPSEDGLIQEKDLGEAFKKSLMDLGVHAFFGVVLRRDQP